VVHNRAIMLANSLKNDVPDRRDESFFPRLRIIFFRSTAESRIKRERL
jgi:hypothetical protein